MAEAKSSEERALSSGKRKAQLSSHDEENLPLKSQKLQNQEDKIQAEEGGNQSVDNHCLEPRPVSEKPRMEEEEEEEEEDDDYEEDDDDDDHEEEEENGNASVDRKGKGILIEEPRDSDDDDDDSSGGGNETEDESDLSDDPLAEVDLDNILPSRTRRRAVPPGVRIAKDANNDGQDDNA